VNISNNRTATKETHKGHSLGEMNGRYSFKFSRKYQNDQEFNTRQICLEFGDACRFVNDLIAQVKTTLTTYATGVMRNFRMPKQETTKPEQLRLNLLAWMQVSVTA